MGPLLLFFRGRAQAARPCNLIEDLEASGRHLYVYDLSQSGIGRDAAGT